MITLFYLSYGPGPHAAEVYFSALSLYRFIAPNDPRFRLVIYTDHPEHFDGLPATFRLLDAPTLADWKGPFAFNHRIKIKAMEDALARFGPSVLLDGDTYFLRSPARLVDRLSPGHAVMHVREGPMRRIGEHTSLWLAIENQSLADAQGHPLTPDTVMWNAGVVGLHPAQLPLIPTILDLTDRLSGIVQHHTIEQLATAFTLQHNTQLSEALDVVYHFWRPYLRGPFLGQVPDLLKSTAHLPMKARANALYPHRPRPPLIKRSRLLAKATLQRLGFFPGRIRSSG